MEFNSVPKNTLDDVRRYCELSQSRGMVSNDQVKSRVFRSEKRDGGSNRNLNSESAKETMLSEMRVHQGMTAFYH